MTDAASETLSTLPLGQKARVVSFELPLPIAIFAGVVSVTLAQPLGRMLQRYITTSPDLADTEIVSIERRGNGGYFKVRTRRGTGLARPVLVA